MRQIAPDLFAPVLGDPHAPAHKPDAPPPPKAAAPEPPPPPPPPITPSRERPLGACAPDMRDFAGCLSTATQLADRAVEQAETGATAALAGRPGINPVVAEGAARALRAAGEAWRVLRERECADLALIEAGLSGTLYQRRLICRIRRDIDRVEFLRERYGSQG